jgi:hypothetical protein
MGFIAKRGDPTTTGGQVFASNETATIKGFSIALHGDIATCGNCKGGTWPIAGTAERMTFDNLPAVQHGDWVLCPCKRNRVIATSTDIYYDSPSHELVSAQATEMTPATVSTSVRTSVTYDQQFRLLYKNGKPHSNVRYKIVTDAGATTSGVTDAQGSTIRVTTTAAESLHLYLVS